ncbi:MAG: rhomboid family intramembrane serine protease [Ignisphaera sp.]
MSYTWGLDFRRKTPIATYAIIIVNVIIYLLSSYQSTFVQITEDWVDIFSYVPVLMHNPLQWYRIVTSMFMHGDIFHIFFNMMFLYWFGRELELMLGIKKYLALYFISGLSATIFHTAFAPITGSISLVVPALGASGAISGILGAFLLTYPRRRLSLCLFYFFIPLCFTTTVALFLLFWFATQVIYGYLRFGGIAFFAHVGGFVAGLSLIYVLKRRRLYETPPWQLIIPAPPFEWHKPIGLGITSKLILSVLLMAVLGGAIYSMVVAPHASSIYIVNIRACSAELCDVDEGVYTPINDETITPAKNLSRIAFNRIVWSNIIKAPSTTYCNNDFIEISWRGVARMPNTNIKIPTTIQGIGKYDDRCILIEFNGSIDTYVVNIYNILGTSIAKLGDKLIRIDQIEFKSRDIAEDAGKIIVRPMALISSAITISSIFVVALKDKDIVEEEFLYIPRYTPWI